MSSESFSGHDFGDARRRLANAVGGKTLKSLHRRSPARAAFHIVGTIVVFSGNAWLLATAQWWGVWLAALLAQGFALQGVGYLVHEYGVHRGLGGAQRSDAFGRLAACLLFFPYTRYRLEHQGHHAHTGADWDEAYKQALNTRCKRLLYLSAPGALWLTSRPRIEPSPADVERIEGERRKIWGFALLLSGLALWQPRWVALGYLLPLATSLPLVSSLRVLLEHAEADPGNPLHCGTWYRSGRVSRLLFAGDAGDCHVVHHLFPGIPSYRMAGALHVLRPSFLAGGVPERTSLMELVWLWFLRCAPHRQPWPHSARVIREETSK